MGNIIAAKCKSCGFSNEFRYGGGRFSYQTNRMVPAINKETLAFENVNYLELKNSDKYLYYTDAILKGNNLGYNTINDFNLELNTVNNYCPNCKEMALDFRTTIYFD